MALCSVHRVSFESTRSPSEKGRELPLAIAEATADLRKSMVCTTCCYFVVIQRIDVERSTMALAGHAVPNFSAMDVVRDEHSTVNFHADRDTSIEKICDKYPRVSDEDPDKSERNFGQLATTYEARNPSGFSQVTVHINWRRALFFCASGIFPRSATCLH